MPKADGPTTLESHQHVHLHGLRAVDEMTLEEVQSELAQRRAAPGGADVVADPGSPSP